MMRRVPLWQPPVPDLSNDPAPQYPYRGTQPRQISRRVFSPKFAPDLLSQAEIETSLKGAHIPNVSEFAGTLDSRTRIPQLVQTPFPGLILAAGIANAIMLVPKNPDRWGIKISNPTNNGNISFSFDAPFPLGPNGVGMGINVVTGGLYQEFQGVSVNAIYVWSDALGPTFPIPVVAYEGQLSVTSNQS